MGSGDVFGGERETERSGKGGNRVHGLATMLAIDRLEVTGRKFVILADARVKLGHRSARRQCIHQAIPVLSGVQDSRFGGMAPDGSFQLDWHFVSRPPLLSVFAG